ncbi:hypothetical protein QEH38_gp41 [Mycobacterium phage LilSpotty]|uniref:Uncharacterized protein n=1 Tax=Mycobacterium phage LilSpotty TaxID=2588512 RepID=A0A4Y6EM56_9CAUD|nr:hypothetical protein QEH38_gp41 [Mycobacterium phage LilSpotty]QDF19773.1 hypothetical protein SEA_LILSPOTTY_41 [Mycobacterium phage LilSpotty]
MSRADVNLKRTLSAVPLMMSLPWLSLVVLFWGFILWKAAPVLVIFLGVFVAVAVLVWVHGKAAEERAAEKAAQQARADAIIARADTQHRQVLNGDVRGVYGDYMPPKGLR